MMTDRLSVVLALIDEANGRDPQVEDHRGGGQSPAALLYGRRMSEMLSAFEPDASEALRIACRAQHLERWLLPRTAYPQTRAGYFAWRNEQKKRHASRVSQLMEAANFDEAAQQRVASLVRKESIKRDTEAQTLEDIACLVFLTYYAAAFAKDHDEAKIVDILRKTLRKMSTRGRNAALELKLSREVRAALDTALETA